MKIVSQYGRVININSAENRREQIYQLIKNNKKIKVAELKDIFKISAVTIGKDLNYLEKKDLIIKNFGVAEYKENTASFNTGLNINNFEEKKKIARAAIEFINDNESIIFYTGSTIQQMAKHMPAEKNIIAVTNSIQTAYELGLKPSIKTILLGGFYSSETTSTFGEQSIKQLSEYNIDKLFISSNGISSNGGISIDQPFEAELNRYILKNSQKVIMLADHTKIGVDRFICVGPITDIDILITDDKAPADKLEEIRQKGVKVIIA